MKPLAVVLASASLLTGCLTPTAAQRDAAPEATTLAALRPGVWVHSAYRDAGRFGTVLSNGLVVVADGEALLVNTAWGPDPDAATADVLRLTTEATGVPVRRAVVTHFHGDSVDGLDAVRAAGVPAYATAQTAALMAGEGLARPDSLLVAGDAWTLRVGDQTVEVFYGGPGHTADNVVVYVPAARVLFGGCLIRPGESDDLGNTADADVARWAETVARVRARYAGLVDVVVPTHGAPAGPELLDHTIRLVETHRGRALGG